VKLVKLLFYNSKIKPADCEACKATGTATFSAASFYLATQFLQLERSSKTRLHRTMLAAMSAGFAAAAVARWNT